MTFDDFKDLCERRRSIRYFSDAPVSKDEMRKLLELARLAPNIENLQPWHFHVVWNKDIRRKLMEASCYGNFVEGAGVFVVVSADKTTELTAREVVWNPKELEYSCVSAMENMMLGATAMGLASCWVSLHHGPVHEILGLPRSRAVVGGIMIGRYRPGEEQEGAHEREPVDSRCTFLE